MSTHIMRYRYTQTSKAKKTNQSNQRIYSIYIDFFISIWETTLLPLLRMGITLSYPILSLLDIHSSGM